MVAGEYCSIEILGLVHLKLKSLSLEQIIKRFNEIGEIPVLRVELTLGLNEVETHISTSKYSLRKSFLKISKSPVCLDDEGGKTDFY